jgi:hypothetical protein
LARLRRLSPLALGRRAAQHGLLGIVATGASMVACYGVLALVGVLGLIGMTVPVNPVLWTAALIALLLLALLGLALNARAHRRADPLLIGIGGALLVGYALIGRYDWRLEAVGFVALLGAALWDRRIYRTAVGC